MKKSDIRKAAKIYAANIVYNSLGTGAHSDKITEDEHEYFAQQVDYVAGRIANGLPDEIFKLAGLDDIFDYVNAPQRHAEE